MPEGQTPGLGDLGDLGQSGPSQSSSVGQDNPALQEFLSFASKLENPAGRALALESKRRELEGQGSSSIKDFLGAALLPALVGGGLALGGQGGLGAFTALGGLNASDLLAKEANAARAQNLEQTQAQLDDQLQRIDKINNRMSQVFIANPEAFINPESGEPVMSADMMGFLVSGVAGVQMFPQTKRLLNMRDADGNITKRLGVLRDGLERSQDPNTSSVLIDGIARTLGWNMGAEEKASLMQSLGRPEFRDKWSDVLVKDATPESLSGALLWAHENGLGDTTDPAFLRRLEFDPRGARATGADAELLGIWERIRKWQANPENADVLSTIREEAGAGTDEFVRQVAELALEGDAVGLGLFVDDLSQLRDRGVDAGAVASMLTRGLDSINILGAHVQTELGKSLGIDPEELRKQMFADRENIVVRALETAKGSAGNHVIQMVSEGERFFRDAGVPMPRATLQQMYTKARERARANGDVGIDGNPKVSAVEEIYRAYLQLQLQRLQK